MRRRRSTPDTQAALIFDATAGASLKRDGMARAEQHAGALWNATMDGIVHALCGSLTLGVMTTDDLWREIGARKLTPPREGRALGPVMRRAAGAGWLKRTDAWQPSERAACHGRDIRVWAILRRM
jgi:hypothetical protein